MAAISRLEVIVDGVHECAYFRPRATPALPYNHNRAGVTFAPTLEGDNSLANLSAHVIKGTPADEAGIRDGDVLIKINGRPPSLAEGPNFFSPAGEKVDLVVRRGREEFHTTVVLRDLIGPQFDDAH
jgi:C-terminal processing protease CtpA/Prc